MAAFEDVSSPDLEQFKGGKWSDWFDAVQSTESNQTSIPEHALSRDNEVARFRRQDMILFGYRPANDKFYLVKCEHCGRLVKPQSLSVHFELKHGSFKLSKPPSSRLSTHRHGKPPIDPTNHKISHSSRHSSHASSHQKSSEPAYTKVGSASQKLSSATTPEKDKRRSDFTLNKSHRPDTSGSKTLANSPARTVKATRNAINSETLLQSTSRKGINKPGGTIQLEQIPESHVVKSRRPSSEANMKHFQKSHRLSSSKYSDDEGKPNDVKPDSHLSMSKSRKNHDNYHHHLHNMPHHDAKSDSDPWSPESMKLLSPNADRKLLSPSKDRRASQSVPLVVLQKSAIASSEGSVNLSHATKRARPPSGNYDSSLLPSRSKIPALHNATTEKELSRSSDAPAGKVRKKEKILPLKAREYDPNKHCGVWVKDDNAHCRRSLTCKVHPLSAKRSVTGRMKSFDELVQDHGREKQRLKEKALPSKTASPMPPPPSPSVQSIMSPPVLSPVEFAVPSPATKFTPLSPPCTPTSQPHVSNASKAKPSASLFPRIFAAWHVDCWDNDDVTEDTSNKLQSSCYTIQRQPQPLVVLNYQARRSTNCQVSYCRKSERQLEAISSNFEKFSTKQSKKSKPLSFTPISGRTLVMSSQNRNSKQKLQKRLSNSMSKVSRTKSQSQSHSVQSSQYYTEQTLANVAKTGNTAMYTRVKQPQIGPSGSLSRKLSNNSSVSAPALSVKQFTIADTPSKSRNRKMSGQVVNLLRSNSNSETPLYTSKVPDLPSASPILLLNSISPSASPSPNAASTQNFYTGTINPTRTLEGLNHVTAKATNKSAIGRTQVVQACNDLSELQDRKQLVVQLPNGLKSLPGNFLLKQGTHSVTLSGNIGALTVPTDDANFIGAQIPQPVKTVNTNNNFLVQGDGSFHINNDQGTISKLLTVQHTNGPVNAQQTSQINTGNTILQNDENLFLDQHIADSQNQPFSAENFVEAIASLDTQNEVNLESGNAANELVKLFQPENCNTQLPNLHQIDTSILGQVLATSNNQQVLQNQLTAIGANQPTANANSDLSQNFMTR